MTFPCAIGAVVDGVEIASQTPDSGQRSPVLAVVPIGARVLIEAAMGASFLCKSRGDLTGRLYKKTEALYAVAAYHST